MSQPLNLKPLWAWPVLLLLAGISLILWSTLDLASRLELGAAQYGIYLGCLLSLGVLLLFVQKGKGNPLENQREALRLRQQELELETVKLGLAERAQSIDVAQQAMEKRQAEQLDTEQKLQSKLVVYQQFKEFADTEDWQAVSLVADAEKEAEVNQRLQQHADLIFNKFIHNEYKKNNQVDWSAIHADMLAVFHDIARVYHPESSNPLLETTLEDLLRAVNRTSLQMLVLLDQLPLDIKSYNLRKTYDRLSSGAQVYERLKPLLKYSHIYSPVLKIGIGTNPMLALIQQIVTEIVKAKLSDAAQAYAYGLLFSLIKIVGDQAVTIFSAGYRFKSSPWILAVELVELSAKLSPLPAKINTKALRLISGLPFVSEYDRICLYRTFAEGKSLISNKDMAYVLADDERKKLVDRLNEFIADGVLGRNDLDWDKFELWRKGVEVRLQCPLMATTAPAPGKRKPWEQMVCMSSPEKKPAKALKEFIEDLPHEYPYILFADVAVALNGSKVKFNKSWLLGTQKRLLLISQQEDKTYSISWESVLADRQLVCDRVKHPLADDCRLSGGQWSDPAMQGHTLILPGVMRKKFQSTFEPLLDLLA